MNSVDKATETQLKNIQTRTGKTLDELFVLIQGSGLTKHKEIRELLQRDLGLGYGDANALANAFLKAAAPGTAQVDAGTTDDSVSALYGGAKADLLPIHEQVMAGIAALGPCEVAPKKGYVSLRRKKQFAMIGPATKMRVEVGLNMKGVQATERLIELPAGGMCQYKVYLTAVEEVDQELMAWIQQAYESAG
jgi:predicted transport protein